MKLKQKIFDYLQSKQPERQTRFPHVDRPLKVLLIYESDVLERNDRIKAIRQDLLRRQMDVTMWGFVEKKEIQTLILPQSRILGLADYNLLGKPRDYVLNDLKAEHYDLLIDLSTRILLPLCYIAMFADADFTERRYPRHADCPACRRNQRTRRTGTCQRRCALRADYEILNHD